jgi:type IV pilus assembly protein PilM
LRFLQPLLPGAAAIGLEMTDTSVKMAELIVREGMPPVVKGTAMEPLPVDAVVEGRIRNVVGVMQAIRAAYARLNTRTKRVHLILPSQHVMVRFFRLPDIPDHELRKLVDFELKHNIHLPFEDPYYDFINQDATTERKRLKRAKPAKDKKPDNKPDHSDQHQAADPFSGLLGQEPEASEAGQENKCDVMMAAASLELIEEYKEAVAASGLNPVSMEIKAFTLYRVLKHGDEAAAEGTVLLVDINERGTDVSIYHDGKLRITRSLSVVIADSHNEPEVPDDPLEQLLLGIQASQDRDADHIAELVHELERLMNFYRYTLNNRDHEFNRIIVTGDIPNMNKVLDGLRNRMPQPIVEMPFGSYTDQTDRFGSSYLSMAVPFGLALRGRS